jgi:hypothetical protein
MAPVYGRQRAVFGYHVRELCRGCFRDLIDDPVVWDPALREFDFSFFYSASSGTSRRILADHGEDNVLVSYGTKNNTRLGTEETHFVDCGGDPQSFIAQDGYETSHHEYLEYVAEQTTPADYWILRDYPCTSGVLDEYDASVTEFQRKTCEAHRTLLQKASEYDIQAQPVTTLQGQTVSDYLHHLNMMASEGVLTDYVAIGGIMPYGPNTQQQTILAVRDALPSRFSIHGLGVNLGGLRMPGVLDALSSSDSGYWYSRESETASTSWRYTTDKQLDYSKATYEYLDHRKTLNSLLIDHAWNLDLLDIEMSDDTHAEGEHQFVDDWVSPGAPEDPVAHLEPGVKRLVQQFEFVGMDGDHATEQVTQETLSQFGSPATSGNTDTQATS